MSTSIIRSIHGNDASTFDRLIGVFSRLMRKELIANSRKGDRPGWMRQAARNIVSDIYYHTGKLQMAVEKGDIEQVKEYAADVANLALMVVDVQANLVELENER